MTHNKKIVVLLISLSMIISCDRYELPELEKPSAGSSVDFTKMVSVGNSLTAGYMNGTMYTAAQNNSFVAILAKQLQHVNGGEFNQPEVKSENGCFNPKGGCTQGRLILKISTDGSTTVSTLPGDNMASFAPYANKSTLNNFGVPGVTLLTASIPGLGGPRTHLAFNPYYARMASNPGSSTLIDDAASALSNGGTFFSFWLGNNDVLGYATGGASKTNLLTSTSDFTTRFNANLTKMLSAQSTAKGAVANIPDVTSIPYFTTVSYNPIPLDAATATTLNGDNGFKGYNAIIDVLIAQKTALRLTDAQAAELGTRKVQYEASKTNKPIIKDETLFSIDPYLQALVTAGSIQQAQRDALQSYVQIRQTTEKDLITLPASSVLGTQLGGNAQAVYGVSVPLADSLVLIPSEQKEINDAITAFNNIIKAAVDKASDRLVLVDAYTAFKTVSEKKVSYNGVTINASITPPFGAFSLDGVHPNAMGAAHTANIFIEAINAKWGSTIPLCNPNDYPSNEFPTK